MVTRLESRTERRQGAVGGRLEEEIESGFLLTGQHTNSLMTQSAQHRSDLGEISGSLSLLSESNTSLLFSVVCLVFGLSLRFESLNEGTVVPAEFLGELTEDGKVAVRSQVNDFDGIRDDHALLLVVWLGDTLVGLRASS
jgi:hypothetical protein